MVLSISNNTTIFIYSIFFMMLLFVLNTYYFYGINLPVVQLSGLIFLIYAYVFYGIKFNQLKVGWIFISIFMLFVLFSLIVNIFLTDNLRYPFALIGLLLSIMVFLFAYGVNINNSIIYSIVNKLTILLLIFWIIQFFAYYGYGYRIDYFIDIVDYKQRTSLGAFGQAFFRPASLFVEPAMYMNAMLLLFYFRLLYNNFVLDTLSIVVLFTVVMTLSTYGYFVFGILGLFYLIVRKKYFLIAILVIFAIASISFLYVGLESNIIIKRLLNPLEDMSGQLRVIGVIFNFVDQDVVHLLFGLAGEMQSLMAILVQLYIIYCTIQVS